MRQALIAFEFAFSAQVAAHAADVPVLSAAAMQTVLKEVAGDFERSSGHRLVIAYGTIGAIHDRVAKGETPEVAIGSSASMSRLVADGRIDRGSARPIARVGVGIVVPASDPSLEVRSAEDLKRALLAARTVVYADPAGGGAAGIHVAKIIDTLGGAAAYAGPLPAELQNYTGVTAGVPVGATASEAASAFLEFLKSPVVAAALKARGMEPQ